MAPPVAESVIRERIARIKQWKRAEQIAPHKPLLLLLALGRIQRGEPRLVAFVEVETLLRRMLQVYGNSRTQHPEYPFWRLQRDGLWETRDAGPVRSSHGTGDPPISEVRKLSGGLPEEVYEAFRARPPLVTSIAREILQQHFAESLHEDIAEVVGLDLTEPGSEPARRPERDRQFRDLVLLAYDHRCAVCGLDMQIDGASTGLEAAHVHWHCHGGPSSVDNGLALCPLHHKALDLGILGLSPDLEILVSFRLNESAAVEAMVGCHHGRPLLGPRRGQQHIASEYADWHRRHKFKAPERRS